MEQNPVLEKLANEQSAWFAKLGVAGSIDATAPGFWGARSLRDLIVHLNFWQAYKNARLRVGIDGETVVEPWPAEFNEIEGDDEQVDAINAWAQQEAASMSAADAISDSHRLWNEQFAIIEQMGEGVRDEPGRFEMFEGHSLADAIESGLFFGHYHEEHGPELAKLST